LRGEGKTTLAARWAKSIAREGSRVLFIDGCRDAVTLSSKPGQAAETQGLYEVLRGEAAPGKVIQAGIWPHIDFLPSGKPAGNLDALWGNLADLVNGGSEVSYQWVILDLPPLATAADVRAAGQIVDDLLVVVEWGRASETQFEQALRALGPVRDRVIGTVINKTPWRSLRSDTSMQMQAQRRISAGTCLKNPEGKGLL
jgi:Mrp family chromosome partitioning ATPase